MSNQILSNYYHFTIFATLSALINHPKIQFLNSLSVPTHYQVEALVPVSRIRFLVRSKSAQLNDFADLR